MPLPIGGRCTATRPSQRLGKGHNRIRMMRFFVADRTNYVNNLCAEAEQDGPGQMSDNNRVSDDVLGLVNEICAQVEGCLIPFLDAVFTVLHGTAKYADKENARRQIVSKKKNKKIAL